MASSLQTAMLVVVLCSVACGVIAQSINANTDNGWHWIRNLKNMNSRDFGDAIISLINITINTYRDPQSALVIPGWSPAALVPPEIPSDGSPGIHAVAYQHNESGKIVVAFRGAISQADFCAISRIFNTGKSPIGGDCSQYDASSLDYLSQAVAYAQKALNAYPGKPLLLSGHSMGSFLALLTSASLSSKSPPVDAVPVVSFSGAMEEGTLKANGLMLKAADAGEAYVVSNKWDSVGNPANAGHAGILCVYESQRPAICAECKSKENPLVAGGACKDCFNQAHALETLLALAQQEATAVCSP